MKKKILIVDDSSETRLYVSSILTDYDIIEAVNGVEALKIIHSTKINLLITDYKMPEMDGFDLVSDIKKNNYDFPIIIITSLKSIEKKKQMLRLGIDNYLFKPFFKEELINVIERALVYHETVLASKSNIDLNTNDQSESFKSKIEQKLAENVSNFNFSVETLADDFEISTKTLTRRTKAIFGQTPNQLMIECRLNLAQEILAQNPRISLKETAKRVGLKNTTYLKRRLEKK
jgi:YesN/AraC family two-component response regulator